MGSLWKAGKRTEMSFKISSTSTTGALSHRTAFHSIQSNGAIANIAYSPILVKKNLSSSDTITHGEEGNVENGEVQGHAQRNSRHEELVLPKWQAKQAFVLGQRVHRVEHFDRDQNRQAHRGRMSRLDAREHIAPDFRKERRTLVEVRLMDYQTPSFANRRARQKIRTN